MSANRPDARTAQAMVSVLDAIAAREGSTFPSEDVQNSALAILAESPTTRGISHKLAPARVYPVERGGRRYLVVLYMSGPDPSGFAALTTAMPTIIDAECTCPAGEARKTCKHTLAVLTSAIRDDGYTLAF